jgi:hypothetical protein
MHPSPQSETDESRQPSLLGSAQRWFLRVAYVKPKQFVDFVRLGLAKWSRGLGARPTALPEVPPAPTLVDLANETDALLTSELRYGCTRELETLLDDVRETIVEDKASYSATPAEDNALDRLWVNLLRLGLFDELVHLVRYYNLPLRPEVRTFIDYCEREYGASKRRGEAYRAKYPGADIFTMGCIVWGDEYVGNFLRYNLRSMLSQDNLPALRAQGLVVCSVVTDAAGELRMRRDALFDRLSALADVEFIVIPDEMVRILSKGHLVANFYILYGMLDHCSIFFAQGAASHLFMIPVDSIVADGSLNNMANFRHEGYECCGGGNIVAETETFLPALDVLFGDDGPIRISTHDLATLAARHAHHYFRSQIVAAENDDFGKHPREVFWPVENGVEIHSVFIHPLFTSASGLAKYSRKHYANIDYGMIPRMFLAPGPIKIIEDTRQAYVNNFTAGNRLYETTGRAFAIEDFLRSHDHTYPVQKGLFGLPQVLPCQLTGWTSCSDVIQDVHAIEACFGIAEDEKEMEHPTPHPDR